MTMAPSRGADPAAGNRLYTKHTDPHTGEVYLTIGLRGLDLKNEPLLNKGTCFTREERRMFGLDGLMPPVVATPAEQEARVYGNYRRVWTTSTATSS